LASALTLFVLSYQVSLFAAYKGSTARTLVKQARCRELAVQIAPWGIEPLLRSSSRYLWTAEREKAWPFIERMYENFPYTPIVLYQTAVMHHQRGDNRIALDLMEKALRAAPTQPDATRWLETIKGSLTR
jgi:hypothetical protein